MKTLHFSDPCTCRFSRVQPEEKKLDPKDVKIDSLAKINGTLSVQLDMQG